MASIRHQEVHVKKGCSSSMNQIIEICITVFPQMNASLEWEFPFNNDLLTIRKIITRQDKRFHSNKTCFINKIKHMPIYRFLIDSLLFLFVFFNCFVYVSTINY